MIFLVCQSGDNRQCGILIFKVIRQGIKNSVQCVHNGGMRASLLPYLALVCPKYITSPITSQQHNSCCHIWTTLHNDLSASPQKLVIQRGCRFSLCPNTCHSSANNLSRSAMAQVKHFHNFLTSVLNREIPCSVIVQNKSLRSELPWGFPWSVLSSPSPGNSQCG